MTINTNIRTAGPFPGNGVTLAFPFSYKVFSRAEVLVAVTDTATEIETILVLDDDYGVTLNADQNSNPGGVIVMEVAPAVGITLAATSNIPVTQNLDLTNGGGFYPTVINDAFDRVVIMIQQLNSRIGLGALNIGTAALLGAVLNFVTNASAGGGALLIGFLRSGVGTVITSVGKWLGWQPPSVLDFMTDLERNDVLAGTLLLDVSDAVQAAVDHCLANNKDLTVEGLCRLDKPVNIDRAVNNSVDEFHIIGRNSTGGFWTDQPISMLSSSIPGFTPGGASSEFVIFDKLRFEASDNQLNCFALDGDAFLRIRIKDCYFRKIRCAYTSNFFQSWYVTGNNIRQMSGIFMEAGVGGDAYVGLDGFAFDLHFTDNIFEEGDMVGQSAGLKGNLFQGQTGPFLECIGGGCIDVSGNYFEAIVESCFKLGPMYNIHFSGNRFGTGSDPAYFPVDCQTAYTVVSNGNFSEGNIYKTTNMQTTKALNDAGFYKYTAKGLVSLGDVAYNGNVTDDVNHANDIKRIQTETMFMGLDDFTHGVLRQKVAAFRTDGVSGMFPRGAFNVYTTAGARDTNKLEFFIADAANGEYATPVLALSNDLVKASGKIQAGVGLEVLTGLVKPAPYSTGTRPAYAMGAVYYDTTLNKLMIGGASTWEVISSA